MRIAAKFGDWMLTHLLPTAEARACVSCGAIFRCESCLRGCNCCTCCYTTCGCVYVSNCHRCGC
jgi:hypothetical protein